MNRKTLLTLLMSGWLVALSGPASANDQMKVMKSQLNDAVSIVGQRVGDVIEQVKDVHEESRKDEIKSAMEDLKQTPGNLDRQLRVIRLIGEEVDDALKTADIILQANLAEDNKKIIDGFEKALVSAEKLQAEHEEMRDSAHKEYLKNRYQGLVEADIAFSEGYRNELERYKAMDIEGEYKYVKAAKIYLIEVKGIIDELEDMLKLNAELDASLEEFQALIGNIESLQNAYTSFADTVREYTAAKE